MSYANGTQFYNLPQTVGTDKRDWFDTNSPFAAIDAALHAAVVGQASDAEAIATINGKLATDEADIAALQTKTNTHDSQIAALQTTVNTQANQISDVRQDAEDMITANNEGAAATSTRAYAIGDYFIYNDVLYKATAAIAVGDTIVPNTNCEATNVDTELTKVNNDLANKVSKPHAADYTAHKDGTKTWAQLLYLVYANIDFSKINAFSFILAGDNYFRISRIQENDIAFVYVNIGATTPQIIKYNIQENHNAAVYWDGSTLTDISSSVADEDISIFY